MQPTHVCHWCMQKSNYYAKLDDDYHGNFCENTECLTIQILSARKDKRADSVENFRRKMKETDLNDEIKRLKDEMAQLRQYYTERTVYIKIRDNSQIMEESHIVEKKRTRDGSLPEDNLRIDENPQMDSIVKPNTGYQFKKPKLVSVVQEIMIGVVIDDPFEAKE